MANKKEMMEDLKKQMEEKGTPIEFYNPFSKFGEWWNKNMYFHYGVEGERLDTSEVLKNIALGKTVEWETDDKRIFNLYTVNPLYGDYEYPNQPQKQEVLEIDFDELDASVNKMGDWLLIGGIVIFGGLVLGLILD